MVPIRVLPALLTVSLLVLAFLAPLPLGSAGEVDPPRDPLPVPPVGPEQTTRLVVGYDEVLPDRAALFIHQHGGEVLRIDPALDFAVVLVPTLASGPLLEVLRFVPGVTYAKEDGRMKALYTPNDPLYSQQWGPTAIGMEAAWDVARGNHSIEVAVLDTGVDYRHNDLAANVCRLGPDFYNGDDDPDDDHYHGTHVAGTVAAKIDNAVGVAGMADACVVPVKVLSSGGGGYWSDLASAIQWSADNGTEIISMSLGGCCDPGAPLTTAVQYAAQAGVLIIAAAGNDYCGPVGYPAAYPEIVAVGSLDEPGDQPSSFSSCGPEVEVSAPGRDILSTMPGGGYDTLSGTSMATPHTSGVAALFWSQFPALDADAVRCVLAQNADDLLASGPDDETGFGRIDAADMLANPNCVPKPPAAPMLVGVSGDGTAALGWNKPHAWGGVDGYRIYRSAASGNATPILVADINTTSYEDTSVTAGTSYSYTVVAYNDAGNSSASDPVTVAVRAAVTLPYTEGFESGLGDWQATGPWHVTTDRKGSGSRSAYFGQENGEGLEDNDYPDDSYGTLTSPPIRVPANGSAHAVFWQYAELESWWYEHPVIEVATVDDPFTFTPVWEMGGYDAYEGLGALDLSSYAGQVVYFRYVVDADFCCGGEGWYVDDITVQTGAPPQIAPVVHVQWPTADELTGGSSFVAASYLDGNGDDDVVNATIRIDDGDEAAASLYGHYFYAWYSGVATGNHTLTATVRDTTGQNGTQVVNIRVDGDPPTIDTILPAEGTVVGCVARLSGTASDIGGSGLSLLRAYRPDLGYSVQDHAAYWYFDGQDQESWYLNVTTAYVPEGPFNLTLRLYDGVDNRATVTWALERNDDTCVPVIDLPGLADGDTVQELVPIQGTVDWPSENATGDVVLYIDGDYQAEFHSTGTFSYTWNTWHVPNGEHTIDIYAIEEGTSLWAVESLTVTVDNDRSPRFVAFDGAGHVGCSVSLRPIHMADQCGGASLIETPLDPGLTGIHLILEWDEDTLGLDRLDATFLVGTASFTSERLGPGTLWINVTSEDLLTADYQTGRLDVRASGLDGQPDVAVDEAFTFRAQLAYWGAT